MGHVSDAQYTHVLAKYDGFMSACQSFVDKYANTDKIHIQGENGDRTVNRAEAQRQLALLKTRRAELVAAHEGVLKAAPKKVEPKAADVPVSHEPIVSKPSVVSTDPVIVPSDPKPGVPKNAEEARKLMDQIQKQMQDALNHPQQNNN